MNKVIYQRKAVKQLQRIPEQQKIRSACNTLVNFPFCQNIKPLAHHKYDYRLRVGNYRVLFNVVDGVPSIVSIEEVKKRDERTY
ncbi:type II toxin-antitoxin system RelE/ParE family toxin [[Haemophilus] felis]|nr:type II toxin-antitoxin system RelE/ParE family toxin [[Haemophilus] felis]